MKIVCFHLNQVGDLVFSLPALKNLRDCFPQAAMTSVVRPGLVDLVRCSGLVDNVLVRPYGIGVHKLALARSLRASRFDLAVVFSQSAASVLLAYLSGAPRRTGFSGSSFGWMLTDRVAFQHPPSTVNNLRLVESLGCPMRTVSYEGLLRPSAEQAARADMLLSGFGIKPEDPVAALAPGASKRRDVKRWTDEGFLEVARRLAGLGIKVVLLGSDITPRACDDSGCMVNLSGATSLAEALAVLARCRVVVGVDSGLLHLAAAAGTRTVGLYGPSDPAVTGPPGDGHAVVRAGISCSPCHKTRCPIGRVCMTQLSPQDVISAVNTVLGLTERIPH